jgi:hypothetical protein
MKEVMDAAAAIMRSDRECADVLPERGRGGELRLLAFRGFGPDAAKFWEWWASIWPAAVAVPRCTGRRVIVPDVEECDFIADTEDLKVFRETGIRACQTTPSLQKGKAGRDDLHALAQPYQPTNASCASWMSWRGRPPHHRAPACRRRLRHRAAQHETLLNQSPLGYLIDSEFRIRE